MKAYRIKQLWILSWCLWTLVACQPKNISQSAVVAEPIVEPNETIDLDCLASLDNPMYIQLKEEAAKVIPSENYELRLLAWDSQVDDRPHYFDSALFWVKQDSEEPLWFLIDMARLPQSSDLAWHLHEATDGGWKGFQEFSVPPDREDVYYFTSSPSFGYAPRFAASEGFSFINANVCEQTWRETIGGAPPHYVGLDQS